MEKVICFYRRRLAQQEKEVGRSLANPLASFFYHGKTEQFMHGKVWGGERGSYIPGPKSQTNVTYNFLFKPNPPVKGGDAKTRQPETFYVF